MDIDAVAGFGGTHQHPTVRHAWDLWLRPEIEKRVACGNYVAPAQVTQALVVWREGRRTEVLLNEEVVWRAKYRPRATPPPPDGAVRADDLEDIERVWPDGVADHEAFMMFCTVGGRQDILFDLSPNHPDFDHSTAGGSRERLWSSLREMLLQHWFGECFLVEAHVEQSMMSDGWFRALCLLPQPYLAMVRAYQAGDREAAAEAAHEYFTDDRLLQYGEAWLRNPLVGPHRQAIEESLSNYRDGRNLSVVCTLLPCFEGVVRAQHRQERQTVPYQLLRELPQKLDALGQVRTAGTGLPRLVHESFIEYLSQYVLQEFKPNAADPQAAAGRNAFLHGQRTDASHTEALQAIIAFDSLCRSTAERLYASRAPTEPVSEDGQS